MAKKALGRGLGAIFEDVEEAYRKDFKKDSDDLVREIDIDLIQPNPYQPRAYFDKEALEDLSSSIKKHGLLQPIIVIQKDDGYMLIAGERRLRATKLAGFSEIKAIVADIESENLRELALIENIQREDLNPIELANAYKELIQEYDITQEELSLIIHKSRAQITNTMRLLLLSKESQELLKHGEISQGHAKVLVGLPAMDEKNIVNKIIQNRLSVRETEALVKNLKTHEKKDEKKVKNIPNEIQTMSEKLSNFGFKTKITEKSLTILFKNSDEIKLLREKLGI